MPQGICKLCLQTKDLQDSHFIPAAMYKYIHAPSLKNPNPIIVGHERTFTTSKQVKDYLLCSNCEGLFNERGEKEVLKWACKGKQFPLGDRLAVAIPQRQFGDALVFSGDDIGLDTEKFGYFALSIIWRATVHEWDTPTGKSTLLDLGPANEPIRKFLHGEAGYPAEAAVVLSICTDVYSRGAFFMPSRVLNFPGMCFVFLTLGLHFMVYIGREVGRILQDVCCVRSAARLIYQRDCSRKTIEMYRDLVMSREPPKNSIL
jgi:hypothetical protein